MAVAILHDRFLAYTERVANELRLEPRGRFRIAGKDWNLPLRPDRKKCLVFVPVNILNDLPIALDRSEIVKVSEFNKEVREAWSSIFANATKQRRLPSKSEIRSMFLHNPQNLRDLIKVYRESPPVGYDLSLDPKGLLSWDEIGRGIAKDFPLDLKNKKPISLSELKEILTSIIKQFRRNIEDNKVYEVLYDGTGKPMHEKYSQLLFYCVADSYCEANNVDISREPNAGNGPVDFKLSTGYQGRILVEVKLSSNSHLIHGFQTQLPAYEKAEATTESIYLIIQVADSDTSIKNVLKMRDEAIGAGHRVPQIVVIDARPHVSASKR